MPWRVVQYLQFVALVGLVTGLLVLGFGQPVAVQLFGLRLALGPVLLLCLLCGIAWGALLLLPVALRARVRAQRERERAATLERALSATLQARLAESNAAKTNAAKSEAGVREPMSL